MRFVLETRSSNANALGPEHASLRRAADTWTGQVEASRSMTVSKFCKRNFGWTTFIKSMADSLTTVVSPLYEPLLGSPCEVLGDARKKGRPGTRPKTVLARNGIGTA